MDTTEKQLMARLYRLDCPSSEELGEYHLRLLPAAQTEVVAQHLPDCPHCRQELAQLQTYLTDLAPELEYTLRQRVQIWIARRLPAGNYNNATPAPALAWRGQTEGPLTYEAGPVQLHLEIQEDPATPGYKSIIGLVIGETDTAVTVQLWQAGEIQQTTSLDEWGNFTLNRIQPGRFDLILSGTAVEIHLPDLSV